MGCRVDSGGREGVAGTESALKQTKVVGRDAIYKIKVRRATLQLRHLVGVQFCPEIGGIDGISYKV